MDARSADPISFDIKQDAPDGLYARILAASQRVTIRRRHIILSVSSRSDDCYLVLSGLLRVTLFAANGREVVIRDIGPGELLGELAAVDGGRRSANIVAVKTSTLAVIRAAEFQALVSETPAFALWFVRHLVRQMRALTQRVFELSALNVRSRLHCQLLRMCLDAADGNLAMIRPAPTHEQLAALVGTSREGVTRELSYLVKIGLLRQEGRTLEVLDVAGLASIVGLATGGEMAATYRASDASRGNNQLLAAA